MTDYKSMFEQAMRTLAAIDDALGIGDDGCGDPEQTLDAIACLKASPISEEAMDILRAENDKLKAEARKVCAGGTAVTRDMITAAHGVTLETGDVVLSAKLLERIYKAMAKNTMNGEWDSEHSLQIDSYATGRPQVLAHVKSDGSIWIEVTDGATAWQGTLQPPNGWKP